MACSQVDFTCPGCEFASSLCNDRCHCSYIPRVHDRIHHQFTSPRRYQQVAITISPRSTHIRRRLKFLISGLGSATIEIIHLRSQEQPVRQGSYSRYLTSLHLTRVLAVPSPTSYGSYNQFAECRYRDYTHQWSALIRQTDECRVQRYP